MLFFFPLGPASPRELSSSVQLSLDELLALASESGLSPRERRFRDGNGVDGLLISLIMFVRVRGLGSVVPMLPRVLLILRLDIGRSRSSTLAGRGAGLERPFPRMVDEEEIVEPLETMRGGKSWISTLSSFSAVVLRP